jgi:hypothetical protein
MYFTAKSEIFWEEMPMWESMDRFQIKRHHRSRAFLNYVVFSLTLCLCGEKALSHARSFRERDGWRSFAEL